MKLLALLFTILEACKKNSLRSIYIYMYCALSIYRSSIELWTFKCTFNLRLFISFTNLLPYLCWLINLFFCYFIPFLLFILSYFYFFVLFFLVYLAGWPCCNNIQRTNIWKKYIYMYLLEKNKNCLSSSVHNFTIHSPH